jgi:hypothetical protein
MAEWLLCYCVAWPRWHDNYTFPVRRPGVHLNHLEITRWHAHCNPHIFALYLTFSMVQTEGTGPLSQIPWSQPQKVVAKTRTPAVWVRTVTHRVHVTHPGVPAQEAEAHMRGAVALEDGMGYMEPPRMYQPSRQCLAYVLLKVTGKPQEAEQVGTQDLSSSPSAVAAWFLATAFHMFTVCIRHPTGPWPGSCTWPPCWQSGICRTKPATAPYSPWFMSDK